MKIIMIDGVKYDLIPHIDNKKSKSKPEKGTLGCKDDCIDYPECHPSCRIRWYHK